MATSATAAMAANTATAAKKPGLSVQKTWAQKTAVTGLENTAWIKITAKAAKSKPKVTAENVYRGRQLLLTPKTAVTSINSIAYRNTINNALKQAKINNVLVLTVAVSRTDASIVVTTAEENTAEDLLKYKAIWEPELDLAQIKKNNKWHKILLHGLPTAVFNTKDGLEMLQEEVELFNKGIKLVTKPVWLSIAGNRQNKMHASPIISVATQEKAQNALRTRVVAAGIAKEMAKQSRIYKRHDQSQQQWTKFASCRTEYFYAIKTAKRNSWTKFLSEANGKEVFQVYKYTKPRLMEKIPPLQTADGKLCHTFNDKCQTFIKAMYPKPPEISQNPNKPNAPEAQWNSLTNNEVKQAIFTSSPKKAAGPDEIGFAIIQGAYKAIAEVMNLTYKILIRNAFHPQC
ncbi:hypothetical protein LPUS_12025 [Lasallia pustulata]|uniref:Reverse transcriptase n=1 Tax=Lasallia pustulata TaxID=136370 RepID=A0A1W5DE23_9LECA|nr:hypothetical protein LPUS_12025 [Lasallia pustulata]